MQVRIEQRGALFFARILDGYRASELMRCNINETPLFDAVRTRFVYWLSETGYQVIV